MSEKQASKGGRPMYVRPIKSESSLADPVTHAELQEELTRLRSAIAYLANCVGANVIGQHDAKRLMALLAPPYERHEHGE